MRRIRGASVLQPRSTNPTCSRSSRSSPVGAVGATGHHRRGGPPSTARPIRGTLWPEMALIEIEEAARRLARAIASDLSLYNAEKIERGIANDSLFEELSADIEEGRALYNSRVSPELYAKNFYDRAIVDLLI